MPISIRYALRSPRKGYTYTNPHPLEIWITINKERAHLGAVWPLKTGAKLMVAPDDWNIKRQASSRRDDPVNRKLTALKAFVEQLFDTQNLTAPATRDSVVYELCAGKPPVWDKVRRTWLTGAEPPRSADSSAPLTEESSLLDAYRAKLIELRLEAGPAPVKAKQINIGRWERGLFLLDEWGRVKNKPVPPCYRVTLSWLKEYHKWLQTQKSDKQSKPISSAMASRYIGKIGHILQWMVEDELLTHNSVKKQTWPRYNDKEIHFLEPEHVSLLFSLEWKGTKGIALWWFLLMCCTGLDYPDALAYARNRASLERQGPAGLSLIGRRLKPPCEEFNVPVLSEVHQLFARYPTGPRDITAHSVNRYTDQIEQELGINWRITNKTGRKTFGCLMLISGYYIGEVSRMLGHRRVSTTEQHYCRMIGTAVDRGRERVGKTALL